MSEDLEVFTELIEARVVNETRAPADEDVRVKDFDPFHHARNRLGRFRDTDDKIRDMQTGAYIDLFRFVRRNYLPDVSAGRLTKTADGYNISVMQNGVTYNFGHQGNLDKAGLSYLVQKVRAAMDQHRMASSSQGIAAERVRTTFGRETNVQNPPSRKVHKPTDRVDDVVQEQNRGFSPTGADSIENVAGNLDGEHWVLGVWDPVEFNSYDLSPADRNFLTKHVAAIAHKVRPGAEPDIDYFTTADFAKKRIAVLQAKHGVPKVSGIRSMQ